MTPNILTVMSDPKLFGPVFRGPTWEPWRAMLAALFGLPMSDERRALYRRHTGRTDCPTSQFLEAWLGCGRRSGKTRIASFVAVFLACFIDWRPYLAPGEKATVMLLAADKKQASVLYDYISGFLNAIPILRKLVRNQTQDTITLESGVEIAIHTSYFRAVRGYSIPVVLCDEIGFWQDGDSSNPARAILQALRPAQAQFPNPLLLCFSSPYAKRGVLYEAYREHFGKSDSPVLVWKAASRDMNPTISRATVLRAQVLDPAAARSEWLAEFREDLESLFSREVLSQLVTRGRLELPPVAGTKHVAFTDPSGGQSDSFTLAIAHREKDLAVLDVIREVRPPFSPEAVVREYCDLLKLYGIHEIHGDRYGSGWSAEQFQKNGVRYRPSERTKSEIYLSFLPMVMSGQVELLEHGKLLNQLCELERRSRSGGKDSVDHVPGAHDDVANAAAGALVEALGRASPRLTLWEYLTKVHETFLATGKTEEEQLAEMEVSLPAPVARADQNASAVNASVVKAHEAQKTDACSKCNSTCTVRRGSLLHCNSCGFELNTSPVEAPAGQRREAVRALPAKWRHQ
jgi:hypothetical protein